MFRLITVPGTIAPLDTDVFSRSLRTWIPFLKRFNEKLIHIMPFINKLKSFWSSTKYFLISPDESIRRKRRLVVGVIVLLVVNVIWVASAELSSVSKLILWNLTLLK